MGGGSRLQPPLAICAVNAAARFLLLTGDHWHLLRSIGPFDHKDAAKLLENFWTEAEEVLREGITVMRTLKIGNKGHDRMKARRMPIARGEHKPAKGEPTVWFTSIGSFAKVFSGRIGSCSRRSHGISQTCSTNSQNLPGGASRTCSGRRRRCRAMDV